MGRLHVRRDRTCKHCVLTRIQTKRGLTRVLLFLEPRRKAMTVNRNIRSTPTDFRLGTGSALAIRRRRRRRRASPLLPRYNTRTIGTILKQWTLIARDPTVGLFSDYCDDFNIGRMRRTSQSMKGPKVDRIYTEKQFNLNTFTIRCSQIYKKRLHDKKRTTSQKFS